VANKPKKSGSSAGVDRRARVEELKRQQQAQERKKTLLLAAIGIGVAAVLIVPSSLVLMHRNHQKHRDPATVGATAAAAQCDAVKIDPATGGQDHVDAQTHVDYATIPPSSGRHFQYPADVNERGYYTTKDTPTVEQLVHNLEHGYTIVWYDPKIATEELNVLKDIGGLLRNNSAFRKIIVAPWDVTRGAFPADRPIAMSHWGGPSDPTKPTSPENGYREFCGEASGGAIVQFMKDHPATDTPEPNTP
jgi:hypothetical protein